MGSLTPAVLICVRLLPTLGAAMPGHQNEIVIGRQELEVVASSQLCQQCIDGSDLCFLAAKPSR
jgi:hypothetical protein